MLFKVTEDGNVTPHRESIRKSSFSLKANTRCQPDTNSCRVSQSKGGRQSPVRSGGSSLLMPFPRGRGRDKRILNPGRERGYAPPHVIVIIMDKCFANAIQPTRTCSAIV